jgi:hypothetical protein
MATGVEEGTIPDIDDPCGRYFRFRDFIECGRTWARVQADQPPGFNTPQQPATYAALRHLAETVVDPLADKFGPPILTYGFASRALVRLMGPRPNTTPRLDQHAACERRADGAPICPRLGAAVDLVVPGVGSDAVALWTAHCVPFDRLYFYGMDRPFHASAGPDGKGLVVEMRRDANGLHRPGSRLVVTKDHLARQDQAALKSLFSR